MKDGPEPLDPVVTVIQELLFVTVQAQFAPLPNSMVDEPPAEVKLCVEGVRKAKQGPSCTSEKFWPAMENCAKRCGPLLAETLIVTTPLPEPLLPD